MVALLASSRRRLQGGGQNATGLPIVGARSVQTSGKARLLHLLDEVGMSQGNVDSTDKWAVFFDPFLCALDMVDDGHFFFQAGGGGNGYRGC